MHRTLTWAVFLTLTLAVVVASKNAPSRGFVRAEDGSLVGRSFYDRGANLKACDSLGVGGTDYCRCLAEPETCRKANPRLYRAAWGNQ